MRQRYLLLSIAFVSLIFFLIGNSILPITDPVESNYALTAKEMVLSGDWLSPRIYGVFWYDKPIFIYWLLCLSYSVFGFTDFAGRLPGGIFGMFSVVITAWFLFRQTRKTVTTLLGAAVLATTLEVWAISHAIITDQMLFSFTAGTMFFAYIGLTEKKQHYIWAAYAMAGFAVLTKGPVGLILPGFFLLIFAAVQRRLDYFKAIFPPIGIVIFCVVALPWYVFMYTHHGAAFIDGFFGLNNVARATLSEHPEMNVWYYYIVLVPLSLLPWTGPCLYALWKRRSRDDYYMFMVIWALGTIFFYSLMATKYPTYSYIANLPLLLLGVQGICDIFEKNSRKLWFIVTLPAIVYWLIFFAASFFLKQGGPWLWLYIFVPLAITLVFLAQWLRAFGSIPILITIGTMIVYGIILPQGMAPFFQYRSSLSSTQAAEHIKGRFYIFGDYRTSFVYYTGHNAIFVDLQGRDKNAKLNRNNIWAKKHLFPEDSFHTLITRLDQHEEISILVPDSDYEDYKDSAMYSRTRLVDKYGRNYLFVTK